MCWIGGGPLKLIKPVLVTIGIRGIDGKHVRPKGSWRYLPLPAVDMKVQVGPVNADLCSITVSTSFLVSGSPRA